ncbi:DUF6111 family protein [Methylocystis sp. IM3]|jgi:hypothetical protein|uniref:DUF6111 family protein n=1 Tax=unclassified Methylocystis TaxID=2625913 RepID=UPI0030F99CCA
MWRAFLETTLLFLTPFLVYVAFQLLQRRWPFVAELWHGRIVSALVIAGLLLAIAGVVAAGFTSREQGAYVPAHVENGRLVPGAFR